MNQLAFCLPYNSSVLWDGRNTELNKHWFLLETITNEDFMIENFQEELTNFYELIDSLVTNYRQYFTYPIATVKMITFIKSPQIIQKYEIDGTYLCVVKTVWLKIFQRKYKNYYNKKMNYYKNPKNIMKRQIYGKWN